MLNLLSWYPCTSYFASLNFGQFKECNSPMLGPIVDGKELCFPRNYQYQICLKIQNSIGDYVEFEYCTLYYLQQPRASSLISKFLNCFLHCRAVTLDTDAVLFYQPLPSSWYARGLFLFLLLWGGGLKCLWMDPSFNFQLLLQTILFALLVTTSWIVVWILASGYYFVLSLQD